MRVLVTGGAGFIGSYVTKHMVAQGHEVCVADRFTYAGKGRNLADVLDKVHILIGDLSTGDLAARCAAWNPDWVVHMAAETHVDRAVSAPDQFIVSNVLGTTRLLQAIYQSWWDHSGGMPKKILVYSTDEVFGSTPYGEKFDEYTPFNPSNAYSASKVGVEAVANSFYVTHDMPIVIVRPCNTYGPGQHPEKVIPKFVGQMLRGESVTVYNDGQGARDWLHVSDHARAVECLLQRGKPGESYNLGADEEHTDQRIFMQIEYELQRDGRLIKSCDYILTPGRPGHDKRYMMDNSKLQGLDWRPMMSFDEGFQETVLWTANHQDWHEHDLVEMAHG
ncbi:MAG: dTDP-glucose 4,6-dehydratase [Gammaproteobacteria bacterium]